jgi:hypothetical protein
MLVDDEVTVRSEGSNIDFTCGNKDPRVVHLGTERVNVFETVGEGIQ